MVRATEVKSTNLYRERFGPFLLAVVVGVMVDLLLTRKIIDSPDSPPEQYLAAVLSLGGVLAGFMATLNALLFGMSDQTKQRLRDSGYEVDLRWYLAEAIYGSFVVCIFSLIAFFLPATDHVHAVLMAAIAHSLASVLRVTKIGTRLLSLR